MKELTIGKHLYRVGKLDAFTQLYIARRLAPCLAGVGALAGLDRAAAKGEAALGEEETARILRFLSTAAGALKDEDVEYICNACLSVTDRKQAGGNWARVRAGGATMFEVTLPELLQIVTAVVVENMGDFFAALPSGTGWLNPQTPTA